MLPQCVPYQAQDALTHMAGASFANDGSFFEQFQRMQQQAEQLADKPAADSASTRHEETVQPTTQESASAQCSKSASPALQSSSLNAEDEFIASTSFTGAMDGFVFTTGDGHLCLQQQDLLLAQAGSG